MNISLETGRLILKPIRIQHLDAFYDFLMRNYEFFKPWSPAYEKNYTKESTHIKKIEFLEAEEEAQRAIKFLIFAKTDISKIIGTVALSNIIKGPFQSCFLGYRVDEKSNGKGYATEAVEKAVDFAFDKLKLHRVEANIMPRNEASIRVVKKLGFVYEGTSKKYLQINGVWEDHKHFVRLNETAE